MAGLGAGSSGSSALGGSGGGVRAPDLGCRPLPGRALVGRALLGRALPGRPLPALPLLLSGRGSGARGACVGVAAPLPAREPSTCISSPGRLSPRRLVGRLPGATSIPFALLADPGRLEGFALSGRGDMAREPVSVPAAELGAARAGSTACPPMAAPSPEAESRSREAPS